MVVNGRVHGSVTSDSPSTFALIGRPYETLAGPFQLSAPSGEDGRTTVRFRATELVSGSEVVLQLVMIPRVIPASYDPAAPNFDGFATIAWSMPDTAPEFRQLRLRFPLDGEHAHRAPELR